MDTRDPSSIPSNAMVNWVTATFAGTVTNVWKYVKSPYAMQSTGAQHTRDGYTEKPITSASGAGPQPGSSADGTKDTEYSHTAPWICGAHANGTTCPHGPDSSPSCISHGVRVGPTSALVPDPASAKEASSTPPPLHATTP